MGYESGALNALLQNPDGSGQHTLHLPEASMSHAWTMRVGGDAGEASAG
jgi:hypothetical protein